MKQIISYPPIQTLNLNSNRIWTENDNYKYYIEEKIDGSQLSIILEENNKLCFYNKRTPISETNSTFMKSVSMLKYNYDGKNILNSNYIYHVN